jgi:hypothetical protein
MPDAPLFPNVHVVEGLPDNLLLFVTPRTVECEVRGCDHVHAVAVRITDDSGRSGEAGSALPEEQDTP